MKRLCLSLAAVLLVGHLAAPSVHAAVTVQPTDVSTNMGEGFGSSLVNLINQSGLTPGYTPLVTVFDDYIATGPTTEAGVNETSWLSNFGTPTGTIDFDLGTNHTIVSMALWNAGGDAGTNVTGFDLAMDDNPAFSSPTALGSFTADPNTGPSTAVLPEVFTFAATEGRYVRMTITDNANPAFTFVSLSEVAFEQDSVVIPTPAAALAIPALLAGLGLRRRRAA